MYDNSTPMQDEIFETKVSKTKLGNFRFEDVVEPKESPKDTFDEQELTNDINFYIRGLMQDLVSNLQYVNNTTPVAVTSFTFLDSDLQYPVRHFYHNFHSYLQCLIRRFYLKHNFHSYL